MKIKFTFFLASMLFLSMMISAQECLTDSNCDSLDSKYCLNGFLYTDDSSCVDGLCVTSQSTEDCQTDISGERFCVGDERYYKRYWCDGETLSCETEDIYMDDCNNRDREPYCSGNHLRSRDYGCIAGSCVLLDEDDWDCDPDYENDYVCFGDERYRPNYFCNTNTDSCDLEYILIEDCSGRNTGPYCSGNTFRVREYECRNGQCTVDEDIREDCNEGENEAYCKGDEIWATNGYCDGENPGCYYNQVMKYDCSQKDITTCNGDLLYHEEWSCSRDHCVQDVVEYIDCTDKDGRYLVGESYDFEVQPCKYEIRQDWEEREFGCTLDECTYSIINQGFDVIDYQENDDDNDGVCDDEDKCLDSTPWYAVGLLKKHFDSSNMDFGETMGCSCIQILECKPGKDIGEQIFGCTQGTLNTWIKEKPPKWVNECGL